MTDPNRSPGGRRRARAVALIVVAVVLLWGVDALARIGAESFVGGEIQDATGIAERPEVQIRGLLFLPQLIRGAYNEVDVTTRGVTSGALPIERVDSQLFDVRVPFRDVLTQDVHRVGIGRSVERATLRYQDLNAYLDATDRPLQLASAPDGLVRMTGSLNLTGEPVEVRADVALSVEDGKLQATPRQIDTGTSTLDEASRLLLGERLRLALPTKELPFGHQLTSATPSPDGIQIEAESRGIVLQP